MFWRHALAVCLCAACVSISRSVFTEAGHGVPSPPDFPTTCDPFGELSTTRPIKTCGVDGQPDTTDPDFDPDAAKAQNRIKNNFCAATGTPALATIKTFDELQKKTPSKTDLPWGSRKTLPTEAGRTALQEPLHDDGRRHGRRRQLRAVRRLHPRRPSR